MHHPSVKIIVFILVVNHWWEHEIVTWHHTQLLNLELRTLAMSMMSAVPWLAPSSSSAVNTMMTYNGDIVIMKMLDKYTVRSLLCKL